MSSSPPPSSNLPPSMGPGARPTQPGEDPRSLLSEITEIRSHYNVHLASDALELAYDLKGQQRHYRLPFDNMPVSGWTKSLCFGGPNATAVAGTLLIDMIRASENMSGRRVTQEEAEGIAFYGSRRMMTMYLGQLTGITMGLGSAWFGRKNMKFPFMKPKSPERYDSFPMRALPLLKGQYARAMWHITRANIYTVMWLFLTNPFFRSIADTRMTVGLYADRRTHNLTEAIKGKFDRLKSNRASEAAAKVHSASPTQQSQQAQDDASPAAFDDNDSYARQDSQAGDTRFTDGNTDSGLISDHDVQQQSTNQPPPNSWTRAQSGTSRPKNDQPQETPSSTDYFFDDASPTAGNDPSMSTSQPYKKQPAGSVWARLRRGEAGSSSNSSEGQSTGRSSPSNQTRDSETRTDGFSFNNSDGEKRLSKQQAQKDFDALLDRERREGGSAEYLRDMQAAAAGEESNSPTENTWSRRRRG